MGFYCRFFVFGSGRGLVLEVEGRLFLFLWLVFYFCEVV